MTAGNICSILTALLFVACPAAAAGPSGLPTHADQPNLIDPLIRARWPSAQSAPVADDATFLRRVSLDLCGQIPRVSEVREFLADHSPDKRARAVERLLASPDFARHFAAVWRSKMLPESANPQLAYFSTQLEAWLRDQFKANVPWDQIATRLLAAPSANAMSPQPNQAYASPASVYFQALEYKPENIAGASSRLLLGVNLECAQCHDHPTASWKREQFWQYAAFFSELSANIPRAPGDPPPAAPRTIRIPNTETIVAARFLDGAQPTFQSSSTQTLAKWITAKENPYFAKSLVNKMWAHFFGIGLLDPIDEPSRENLPSHPDLLDALAKDFTDNNYDLKQLIRLIVNSNTYQLDSAATTSGDPRLFARMSVRGLSPEQIYDSLLRATGYRATQSAAPMAFQPMTADPRAEFLARFGNRADKPTEAQTTILQALSLMNGQLITQATDLEKSQPLAAVSDVPFMTTAEKIETLFLATLSRPPRGDELKRLTQHVTVSPNPNQALSDIFWVLLNTTEFRTNH